MAVLDSNNVKNRPDFAANSAALKKLVDELKANLAVVAQGGGKVANERHTARGKLLPRERVAGLLDPGSPFLELAPLAAWGMYGGAAPGAGAIAGIGRVSGVDCMIVCNDATVKGGTYYPLSVKKHLRAQEVWMWPNARISVMGGEQAAGVLATVKRNQIEAKGGTWSKEEEAEFKAPTLKQFDEQSQPYYATARLWDDGLIDPADTRRILGMAISASLNADIPDTKFGVYRM